ncbi:MAG: hypothetical protein LIR46_12890 [Bacteroidota bacterium]|nr:hypothetical protein [Bacteroidota bacterium]
MTSKEGLMQMKDFLSIAIAERQNTIEKLHEKEDKSLSNGESIPYDVLFQLYTKLHELDVLQIAFWRCKEIIDEVND